MMNVNNLVAAVIVEVMIGLSSRLRGQKARTVNILAVDVDVDVDDDDNNLSLLQTDMANPQKTMVIMVNDLVVSVAVEWRSALQS